MKNDDYLNQLENKQKTFILPNKEKYVVIPKTFMSDSELIQIDSNLGVFCVF